VRIDYDSCTGQVRFCRTFLFAFRGNRCKRTSNNLSAGALNGCFCGFLFLKLFVCVYTNAVTRGGFPEHCRVERVVDTTRRKLLCKHDSLSPVPSLLSFAFSALNEIRFRLTFRCATFRSETVFFTRANRCFRRTATVTIVVVTRGASGGIKSSVSRAHHVNSTTHSNRIRGNFN